MMKLRLRTKLIGSFFIVIVTCGAVATVVGVQMVGNGIVNQAQDKVRLDLNSARVIYRQAVADVRDVVRHTAMRFFVSEAISRGEADTLAPELEKIRRRESLDILTLTDPQGKVLLRARNSTVKGDSQADNEMVKKAFSSKKVVASTEILPREELFKEGEDLAAQAHVQFVRTPRAKPTDRTEETSGMVIKAAAPVLDARGEILGVLYGGKLLNRDYSLVDKIKQTVYQEEKYDGKDMGTATIFQGDLRISTNVETIDGKRAIGTRVSEEVRQRVLVEGKPWIERAFVVNDWYITAYEPMRDVSGRAVGILYVGMLEQKFSDMKRRALLTFSAITLGGVVLSIVICLFLTRMLVRPVKELMLAAQEFASGDLEQRVHFDDSTKEIAALGRTFNYMASSIEDRDEQLRRRAQEEISKSERLALIGRLAAGVAHEINNPLGGILLHSGLLKKKLPAGGVERENAERIAKDAERCKKIVQGLLDFARQREPEAKEVDVNDVVGQALDLLENQAAFHNVEIIRKLEPDLPPVNVDPSQMQQVFVNVIMNAAEAMGGEGVLTIGIRRAGGGRVEISFADTGPGIPEEALGRLFEPFFTTKEVGHGTGLGLSISHGIVEEHGGELSVSSRVGEGTVFTVSLPAAGEDV